MTELESLLTMITNSADQSSTPTIEYLLTKTQQCVGQQSLFSNFAMIASNSK